MKMEEYCVKNTKKIEALEKQNEKQIETIHQLLETQKKMMGKLDEVLPTILEINDMRNAWSWTGRFLGVIVKIVISTGVIIGGIYAIKEWIKKP